MLDSICEDKVGLKSGPQYDAIACGVDSYPVLLSAWCNNTTQHNMTLVYCSGVRPLETGFL